MLPSCPRPVSSPGATTGTGFCLLADTFWEHSRRAPDFCFSFIFTPVGTPCVPPASCCCHLTDGDLGRVCTVPVTPACRPSIPWTAPGFNAQPSGTFVRFPGSRSCEHRGSGEVLLSLTVF